MSDRPALEIVRLAERPQHLDTVARWVREQWRDHSSLSQDQKIRLLDPADCPATLLTEEGDAPVRDSRRTSSSIRRSATGISGTAGRS